MSIVNAFVSADCGIVCVDTQGALEDGRYIEVSKLVPPPHVNAVAAYRGIVMFMAAAVPGMFATSGDFDELARHMPDILTFASNKAAELALTLGPVPMTREEAGCGEMVIVGFSPERSRIVGHHFRRETLDRGFVTTNNIIQFSAPSWEGVDLGLQKLAPCPSRQDIEALMLAQLREWRAREKEVNAAGGRIIYSEVRRGGITIEHLQGLPPRDAA